MSYPPRPPDPYGRRSPSFPDRNPRPYPERRVSRDRYSPEGSASYRLGMGRRGSRSPPPRGSREREREWDRDRDREREREREREPSRYNANLHHDDTPEPGQILSQPRSTASSRPPSPSDPHPPPPPPPGRPPLLSPPHTGTTTPGDPLTREVASGGKQDGEAVDRTGRPSLSREEQGGTVMNALERFTDSIHSLLLLSTSCSLASSHLARLRTFPSPPPSSLADAQLRVDEAQRSVDRQKAEMRGMFEALILSALPPGAEKGVKLSWEVDRVHERLRTLEEDVVVHAKGKEREAEVVVEVREGDEGGEMRGVVAEGKRTRAREMLEEVVTRLDGLEDHERRLEDVEAQLSLGLGEVIDGIRGWGDLEVLRDPARRKRKRKEEVAKAEGAEKEGEEDEWGMFERARDPEGTLRGVEDGRMEVDAKVMAGGTEVDALREEVRQLRAMLSSTVTTRQDGTEAPMVGADELQGLREEMRHLQADLRALKAAAPTASEAELDKLRKEMEELKAWREGQARAGSSGEKERDLKLLRQMVEEWERKVDGKLEKVKEELTARFSEIAGEELSRRAKEWRSKYAATTPTSSASAPTTAAPVGDPARPISAPPPLPASSPNPMQSQFWGLSFPPQAHISPAPGLHPHLPKQSHVQSPTIPSARPDIYLAPSSGPHGTTTPTVPSLLERRNVHASQPAPPSSLGQPASIQPGPGPAPVGTGVAATPQLVSQWNPSAPAQPPFHLALPSQPHSGGLASRIGVGVHALPPPQPPQPQQPPAPTSLQARMGISSVSASPDPAGGVSASLSSDGAPRSLQERIGNLGTGTGPGGSAPALQARLSNGHGNGSGPAQ